MKKDASQLAAEFLKLWQDHITKTMTDPATIRSMLEMMQGLYPQPAKPAAGARDDARTRRPAPSPDVDGDALRSIHTRLSKLERSVDKLHARLDAAEKPAGAKHGRDVRPVAAAKHPTKRGGKPVAKRKSAKRRSK